MLYLIITTLVILLGYYLYKGYKNTHAVAINTIEIDNDNDSSSNKASPLRVLHISDMHIEHISISPERLYGVLKEQPIDLIALTGDFLDRRRSIPKLIPFLEALRKINPVYGSYAVFGNHDYVLRNPDFNRLKKLLNEHGFKTLQNENDVIEVNGKTVNIIGIDDFSTKQSNLIQSFSGLEKGYNLILTHDPNIVLNMDNYHYNFLLSGHFHGGQICWPKPYHLLKMGKLVRMNMVKGLQQYNGRQSI